MERADYRGRRAGHYVDQRQSRDKNYGQQFPESRHGPDRQQQLPGSFLEWWMEWKLSRSWRRPGLSLDGAGRVQWQQCHFGGRSEFGELERFHDRTDQQRRHPEWRGGPLNWWSR